MPLTWKVSLKPCRVESKKRVIAEYTPCIAHWMNLLYTHAAEYYCNVIKVFVLSQKLYNSFTESTHQSQIPQRYVESGTMSQSLSNTRWATRVLKKHWQEITQASVLIGNNYEKSNTRNTAKDFRCNLERLETAFTSLPGILDLCQSLSNLWPIQVTIFSCTKREFWKSLS